MADPMAVDEITTATPETRRGRSGTLVPSLKSPVLSEEVPEEHLNVPTKKRLDLLAELGEALSIDTVPASFWACVQVCDIGKLEEFVCLVKAAKAAPFFVSCFMDNCNSIPRRWMQRAPKARDVSTNTTST